jgi:hypothetical protein
MDNKTIIRFIKQNIEPLEDSIYGHGYRAAVYLKDGTYLPCVIFRNAAPLTNLALKRFKEEKKRKGIFTSAAGYYQVVKSFVGSGNRLNDFDIDRIEESKYAFPVHIQKQIIGETTMGWTGFAAKMKDGNFFGFGTNLRTEFFQLPEGYEASDIEKIINHSYVTVDGKLRFHKVPFAKLPDDYNDELIYRERMFFECFLDEL